MFLLYMGGSTSKLLKKLKKNGIEKEEFKKTKTALTSYFAPKKVNPWITRSHFRPQKQISPFSLT